MSPSTLTYSNRHFMFYLNLIFGLLIAFTSWSSLAVNANDWWIYIKNDRESEIAALLRSGANPNIKTDAGNPAIMQAVRDGSWKVFDVLAAHPRTDVNADNNYEETPLMYVALVGNVARAQKLIDRGAQVNRLGWTPLHYAAAKSNEDMVKFLLSKDALPNAPAPDGTSPLMMAAQAETVKPIVIQLLIDAGADPYARNLKGDDAIDVARKKGNTELANALEKIAIERRQKAAQGK